MVLLLEIDGGREECFVA